MKEKTLFTIIASLLVAILGVGAYAAFNDPSAVAQIPSTTVGAVTTAVTDVIGSQNTNTGTTDATTQTDTSGTAQTAGTYTMAQIATHNSASSCYTAIRGSVYDLTPFIDQHPGGSVILTLCGTDGTAAFMAQHAGQREPEAELASLKIGALAK